MELRSGNIPMTTKLFKSEISAEELAVWKAHPTTVKVFDRLRDVKGAIMDKIAQGGTLNLESCENTQAKTALAVGKIAGINELIFMKPVGDTDTSSDNE